MIFQVSTILLISAVLSIASASPLPPTEIQAYKIDEASAKLHWPDPEDLLIEGIETLVAPAKSTLNLLNWKQTAFSEPVEPYNRRKHFGSWITDPRTDDCLNTRARVLIRDSKTEVGFKKDNPCAVDSGTWEDPYSAKVLYRHDQVQVDHMVPLKNTYVSGGWAWSQKRRCLYANFTANNIHLITVASEENLSKGDSTPENYLPKNGRYVCEYLHNWLKIKMIWGLKLKPQEAEAIKENVASFGCDPKQFVLSLKELAAQRTATEKLQVICE